MLFGCRSRPSFSRAGAPEGTFAGLAAFSKETRYALVVHAFHAFHAGQWERQRAFFEPLWERTGLPLSGAITTLFHGNYEHTPVGVHKDRFATFLYALEGRKRMRFWRERPWTAPVTTVLDYQPHLAASFTAEPEPGDLLYWPADYYHVGESVDGGAATSVNVGVPREAHRAVYDVDDLLLGKAPDAMVVYKRQSSRSTATPTGCGTGSPRSRSATGARPACAQSRRPRGRPPPAGGAGELPRPGPRPGSVRRIMVGARVGLRRQ